MTGRHADRKARKRKESNEPKVLGERRLAIASERKLAELSTPKPTKRKRSAVDWILVITAEILLTVAAVTGLFLLWKFVLVESVTAVTQSAGADKLIKDFQIDTEIGSLNYDSKKPPVTARPGHAESFAVLYIPRLDPNYKRVIAEGTTVYDILNDPETGVGHYAESQMPGEKGNFALAGHRNTVFDNLKSIVPGDKIYVQTAEGYYTYQVKTEHIIVKPTDVQVIAPVPNEPGKKPTKMFLTLTTCYPEWSNTERLIVFAEFVEWRPLAAGAPAEIAAAAAG